MFSNHKSRGWFFYEKRAGGESRMTKYNNKLYVIVGKGGRIFFSTNAMKFLGEPAYIACGQRGSNIGLTGSTSEHGFKVTYHVRENPCTPYISAKQFITRTHIDEGAYECHIEDGALLVFDMAAPAAT